MSTREQTAGQDQELEQRRRLRIDLSRIIEPEDWLGMQLIHLLGVEDAHALVTDPQLQVRHITDLLAKHGESTEHRNFAATLQAAVRRWKRRAAEPWSFPIHERMEQLGAALIIPEDQGWPTQLADLGQAQPLLLWVRGNPRILSEPQVAVVGARAASPYGVAVTEDLVGTILRSGHHVTSGGAYGIDAAGHHAALRCQDDSNGEEAGRSRPATIAVLAGGIDRYYPAGNRELLQQIALNGAVISEALPGRPPSRYRFLSRNRLIAALSSLIVVVEAQHRSGALNTAHHGLDLGRPVAAVPGSIYAGSSAGCHRLIQQTPTELIYRDEDLERLLDVTPARQSAEEEALDLTAMMVLACLPVSKHVGIDGIIERTGLAVPHVLSILTQLAATGYAVEHDQLWRSTGRSSHARQNRDTGTAVG